MIMLYQFKVKNCKCKGRCRCKTTCQRMSIVEEPTYQSSYLLEYINYDRSSDEE